MNRMRIWQMQSLSWQQRTIGSRFVKGSGIREVMNGRYVRATVVDHIKPHRGDQRLFWDEDNWQALCKECHDRKTLTEDINPTYTY